VTGQLAIEPSFLSNEYEFYSLAILTFIHAYRHGGRYMWLWWTTIAHGLMTELVSYWTEPIDNFWHAQSTFMFFGQREPLHIMCLYPGYIYTASVAVSRLGVSELTESCATALFVLMFDIPYDILGVKLLWWTWHDTDANIRDRHMWVPWTSYYFHLTFACAFSLIYHRARRYFVGISGLYSNDDIQRMPYAQQRVAANWKGELKALAVTGFCSMPFGIVQFVPGYHIFADIFHIHAEVTTCILGSIYALVLFYGLQRSKPVDYKEVGEREEMRGDKKRGNGQWHFDECFAAVCMHYLHYCVLVLVGDPANKEVRGMHQPMGSTRGSGDEFDCGSFRNLSYPYPFTPVAFPPFLQSDTWQVSVWKRPFICPYGSELFDEGYFNFACEQGRTQNWVPGNQWYFICGTDWSDGSGLTHVEYILVVFAVCFIGFNAYAQAFCYPRNAWEQFFVLGEFPKYYKTNPPNKIITEFMEDRVNEEGRHEIRVKRKCADGSCEEDVWQQRTELVQDGVGPVYGERNALYGVLFDTYGSSTRDRIRTRDGHRDALYRIQLFEQRAQRKSVAGICYQGPVPKAAILSEDGNQVAFEAKNTEHPLRRRSNRHK